MKKNQKGFGAVEGLLIFLIIAILGGVGYYVWHSQKNTNNSYNNASAALASSVTTKSTKNTQPASDIYSGWKTASFSNGTSLKYPNNWILTSTDNGTDNTIGIFSAPTPAGKNYNLKIAYQVGSPTYTSQKVLDTSSLGINIPGPLYMVTLGDASAVSAVCVTDQKYAVGSTTPTNYLGNGQYDTTQPATFTASNGKKYLLCADLELNQTVQEEPAFTQTQYTTNPSYQDAIKVFKSLKD